MKPLQPEHFWRELDAARALIRDAVYEEAQRHLERAHVLGQQSIWPHVVTHRYMLKVALHRRQLAGVAGQAVRIVLGAIGSAVGSVPIGNTGGTDVSMFKRMPIHPDLWPITANQEPNDALAQKRHASVPKSTDDTF